VADAPSELIASVPLFGALAPKDVQQIARSFKERTFSAGDVIAEEGKGGVGFFVIEAGTAKVTVRGEERATLGPGSYFGEVALIDDGARTATVTAETELRCYGLTSWEFRPLVEMNPSIAWHMLQTLAQRLREAEQRAS
jgi:CRP-like cAMP-binding protein